MTNEELENRLKLIEEELLVTRKAVTDLYSHTSSCLNFLIELQNKVNRLITFTGLTISKVDPPKGTVPPK